MARCDIVNLPLAKACSGKCKADACRSVPRVWVLAASEGIIGVFEKNLQGELQLGRMGAQSVFYSLEDFQKAVVTAEAGHNIDQLVIVGSGNDIAWLHAALPQPATRHIAAEIEYPLLSGWFKQPMPLTQLTQALEQVFSA